MEQGARHILAAQVLVRVASSAPISLTGLPATIAQLATLGTTSMGPVAMRYVLYAGNLGRYLIESFSVHMQLYAAICSYMQLYAAICSYMQSYMQLYAAPMFWSIRSIGSIRTNYITKNGQIQKSQN